MTVCEEKRASTSFSDREVQFLDELLRCCIRGGDPRVLLRAPARKSVLAKVRTMRAVVEKGREQRAKGTACRG